MKNIFKIFVLLGFIFLATLLNNVLLKNGKLEFPFIQAAKATAVIECPTNNTHYGKCHKPKSDITAWGAIISTCMWTGYTTDFCPLSFIDSPCPW